MLLLFCCSTKKMVDADNSIDSTALVSVRYDTTFMLGAKQYHILSFSDATLCMVGLTGDTLIKAYDVSDVEFDKVDDDSLPDIRIHYYANAQGIEDVFLADGTNGFREVESFADFPAWNRLTGTSYYYSYHRSGCADRNWDSDLFYIEDFKTYCIGNISGLGCGDTDPKDGIYISSVCGDTTYLIETLPIDTISAYEDYKWGFIQDYWARHYRKFIGAKAK